MSWINKVKNFVIAIIIIVICTLFFIFPKDSYPFILLLLCIFLFAYGIKKTIYYFMMAKKMVGGISQLFIGILFIDLGFFTISLQSFHIIYVAIYLGIIYMFSGVISLLRAIESKSYQSTWKSLILFGISKILLGIVAIVAGIFYKSEVVIVYIFCLYLLQMGITKIISSLKNTSIIFVE